VSALHFYNSVLLNVKSKFIVYSNRCSTLNYKYKPIKPVAFSTCGNGFFIFLREGTGVMAKKEVNEIVSRIKQEELKLEEVEEQINSYSAKARECRDVVLLLLNFALQMLR